MFQNKISHRNTSSVSNGSKSVFQCQAEGLLDCTLPHDKWTHGAHMTATLYLLRERRDIDLHEDMPGIIRRYNIVNGTANTDHSGFHATLTHFYIEQIRAFNAGLSPRISTGMACRLILLSPLAKRNYPFNYYSKERLFSIEARRKWVCPDLEFWGFRFLAA